MNKIFFSIIFIILSVCSKSQVIDSAIFKVTYQLKMRPDSNNFSFYKEDRLVLEVGNNYSRFYSYNNYLFDSTIRAQFESQVGGANTPYSIDMKGISSGSSKITIRNNASGMFIIFGEVGMHTYRYIDSVGVINWKLTGESDSLYGYTMTKAVAIFRGRKWEAWFTSDIPVSAGPYLFSGLPGLIIKLREEKNNFEYQLTSLDFVTNKTAIEFPKKRVINVSRKDYRTLVQRMINNPNEFALSQGMIFITKSINGVENPPPPPKPPYNPIELE